VGMLSTMARTVAPLACSSQSQPLGRPSSTPCCGLAESAGACVGVTHLLAMARQTGGRWLTTHVQNLPEVKASLLPAAPEEVLDLEEMWRGVRNKEQARWVWTAMCRLTETPHRRLGHWRPKPARPAFGSGKPLRMGPNPATPSVIGGMPLKTCSWLKLLPVVGRKLGRPRRWNGGTPPSTKG
jgi:hypothetical protein